MLVAIIVAAIVVAAVALRDGDNGTVRAGNGESDVVTTSRRSSTTTTTEPRSERRDIEILKQGFSVFQPEFSTVPQGSYAVVFTNPNSTGWIAMSVSVNASFFDEADVVVKTEANNIAAILPGQSAAIGTSVYDMPPTVARMEVQARVGRWEETEETTGSFSFEGVSTSEEQFSGLRTNATLVSTFARDLEDIQVVAVYLTSDGQVVGGDFTFADFVPTGGTIGVEVSAFGGVPNVAAAELYANLSSLGLL